MKKMIKVSETEAIQQLQPREHDGDASIILTNNPNEKLFPLELCQAPPELAHEGGLVWGRTNNLVDYAPFVGMLCSWKVQVISTNAIRYFEDGQQVIVPVHVASIFRNKKLVYRLERDNYRQASRDINYILDQIMDFHVDLSGSDWLEELKKERLWFCGQEARIVRCSRFDCMVLAPNFELTFSVPGFMLVEDETTCQEWKSHNGKEMNICMFSPNLQWRSGRNRYQPY